MVGRSASGPQGDRAQRTEGRGVKSCSLLSDVGGMSLESVLDRIASLNAVSTPVAPRATSAAATTTAPPTPRPGRGTFAQALTEATTPPAGNAGMVATAKAEVGQVEAPPGSNDSARIAQYRSAVPGGPVGPWCAYFASWVAKENGKPLGDRGQGFARVDDVYAWAQRTGRALPNGPAVQPRAGDLIIWDEHMGIVESVAADGTITTIEGNSSDSVARRQHDKDDDGAIGYVSMR